MDLPFNGVGLTKKKGGVGPGPGGGGGTGSRPPSPTESDQAVSCFACRCCKPATPKDKNMVSRSIQEIKVEGHAHDPFVGLVPTSLQAYSVRMCAVLPFLLAFLISVWPVYMVPMLTERRVGCSQLQRKGNSVGFCQ